VPFAALAGRIAIVGDSDIAVIPLRQDGVEVETSTDIAGLSVDRIRLDHASCEPVPGPPEPHAATDRLTLARSAALLGSAYGAYDLTRQYVTDRQQFGAPLINIPAVSGALAQMAVRIRNARSAVDRAVEVCTDGDSAPLRRFAAVASARVTTAGVATLVAQSTHQLHGAVGVTHEYGLHRYTRMLWALRDADESERMLSGRLGNEVRSAGEPALWDEISA